MKKIGDYANSFCKDFGGKIYYVLPESGPDPNRPWLLVEINERKKEMDIIPLDFTTTEVWELFVEADWDSSSKKFIKAVFEYIYKNHN